MAITVTATAGGSTANGIRLRVRALQNVATVQNGAICTQSGAAAHQASMTTTVTGSRPYGSFIDASNTAFTGDTGMTVVDNVSDTTNVIQHGNGHGANTGTPGAVTLGASAPADAGGCAFYEVLFNGPVIEAVTSVLSSTAGTSASVTFGPPGGSLLVAMVTANGGASVTTMTVSDSRGLAWTEVAAANAAGQKYAGVWLAVMPAESYAPVAYPPLWLPGNPPGMPGSPPFVPWPMWRQAGADVTAAATAVTATGSLALPLPGVAGTATETSTFSGTVSLPRPALAGTAAEIFTCTGSLTLPHPAAAGSALAGVANTVTAYTPPAPAWHPGLPSMPGGTPFAPWPVWDQLALPIVTAPSAAGSLALPHPGLSGTAVETATSTGSIALRHPGLAAAATETSKATGSLALPRTGLAATAKQVTTTSGSAALPHPALAGTGATAGGITPHPGAVTVSNQLMSPVTVTSMQAGAAAISDAPANGILVSNAAAAVTITSALAGQVQVGSTL